MKMNVKKAAALFACVTVLAVSAPSVFADNAPSSVGTPPQIAAQSAVLLDANTMQVYYNKNMHEQLYPASITKIMTGLLVAENGNPNALVTVGNDVGNAQSMSVANIALQPGEQLTQDSLMYTMFLASANDAAYVLAEDIGGTVGNFVSMMNYRARQLGATDTHFDNPNGLPDKNNYTSAYDMALIARQAVNNTEELKYFGATAYTLPSDNIKKTSEHYGTLVNMLRPDSQFYYNGIIAGKSGWIEMSGYTLVTAAKRGDRTLICVQMKSDGWSSIYNDSKALFDYGFAQPESVQVSSQQNSIVNRLTPENKAGGSAVSKVIVKQNAVPANKFISRPVVIAGIVILSIAALTLSGLHLWDRRRRRQIKVNIE